MTNEIILAFYHLERMINEYAPHVPQTNSALEHIGQAHILMDSITMNRAA